MSRDPEAWIDLTDFHAGIVNDVAYAGVGGAIGLNAPAPDGAAMISNTYRCVALAGGGLGPLPANNFTYSRPTVAADVATWYVQFCALGPITLGNAAGIIDARNVTLHPVEFILAMEGIGTSTTRRVRYFRDRVFQDGATVTGAHIDSLLSVDSAAGAANTNRFNPSWLIPHTPTYQLPNIGPGLLIGRSSLTESIPLVSGTYLWPDPTSGITSQSVTPLNITWIPSGVNGRVLSHQGRMVQFFQEAFNQGPVGNIFANDQFVFSTPGNVVQDGSTSSLVTYDAVTGLGVCASISASDMLLINHLGGAVLVQGDLANPTVRRMPGAISTGGVSTIGIQTPMGYVYGANRGGICAWTGESSRVLSAQLPPDCWVVPGTANLLEYKGRFALWDKWILCPNNWLFDTDAGSWWRIEDRATKAFYEWQVNPINGYAYGNVPQWTDGGTQMVGYINGFDRSNGATNWSWQSQPLARTRNRVVEVREVTLCCVGAGTIATTFTARDGTTQTQTVTLTGSTQLTQYLRASFAVQGSDVKVRFVSDGGGSTAPILLSAHIGYNERMRVGVG